MELTGEQAKKLLQGNTLNLARRVTEGKLLSPKEVAMLESIAAGNEAEAKTFVRTQEDLGKALGVTRKSIQRWLKIPNNPGAKADGRYDVMAWRQFAQNQGKKVESDREEDSDFAKEKARNILLQNKKLEFQLKVLRKEYVEAGQVEVWGAELAMEIRKAIMAIHIVAPSIVGLTIAEAEMRLKELEDEILAKLHLLGTHVAEMKEASSEE